MALHSLRIRGPAGVARQSSDQFLMLLDGINSLDQAMVVAEKLCRATQTSIPHGTSERKLSLSIGGACMDPARMPICSCGARCTRCSTPRPPVAIRWWRSEARRGGSELRDQTPLNQRRQQQGQAGHAPAGAQQAQQHNSARCQHRSSHDGHLNPSTALGGWRFRCLSTDRGAAACGRQASDVLRQTAAPGSVAAAGPGRRLPWPWPAASRCRRHRYPGGSAQGLLALALSHWSALTSLEFSVERHM
jgi:hypothetical protein